MVTIYHDEDIDVVLGQRDALRTGVLVRCHTVDSLNSFKE